jgi:hypothetical protein
MDELMMGRQIKSSNLDFFSLIIPLFLADDRFARSTPRIAFFGGFLMT